MFTIIRFELKKMAKSTFFRVLLIGCLLFILSYYIYVHIHTMHTDDLILENEADISRIQSEINSIEDSIEAGELEAEEKETSDRLDFLKEEIRAEQEEIKRFENKEWTPLLNKEIEQYEQHVANRIFRDEYYSAAWPTLVTEESKLEYHKWLRDKEITPVYPIHYFSWVTLYDQVYDPPTLEESLEIFSTKYSSTGIYFTHHVFTFGFNILGACFFLFLFGDIVTKEGLGKNGSIQLLRTQPIRRSKLFIGKFLTILLVTFLLLLGTVLLSFILGTIFDRFGDWDYPVLIYGEEFSFNFMNMGTFLLQSASLFFLVLIFCYSILFFFSIITKKALVAIGLTIAILFAGIGLSADSVMSMIAPYIPFHYFSVREVITNELALTLENSSFSFKQGMIVLAVSSVLLWLLTYGATILQKRFS
ncbi:ABC transporter, permease component [Oceanobacillus picturae]|uniref:ABC transporter, permease component n=1 Tax=Oceanobacillus picturae TaxID=171693 RepID=A0A0U9HAY6_9BACI|nr:ABC transporter permease subunit [Oceanobacillus picturae]GAQ17284.1 ABC transporter, permease component [Oceanobacillus picturae]